MAISPVDREVDRRLELLGRRELAGRAAVANAKILNHCTAMVGGTRQFKCLAAKGARLQHPLWVAAGRLSPESGGDFYYRYLVARGAFAHMSQGTMAAFNATGSVGSSIDGRAAEGHLVLDVLAAAGIDLFDVGASLEAASLSARRHAWTRVNRRVQGAVDALQPK
jgi:transaldolase